MSVFIRNHLLIPFALFALLLATNGVMHIDQHLTDAIYAWQDYHWTYQHHWLTESVIHTGGRALAGGMLIILFTALLLSFVLPSWRSYRSSLSYLTLAIVTSFVIINGLKAISGIPCPWDVTNYGGSGEMRHWYQGFSGDHGCFPAGHASGGYVWVALYFFALIHAKQYRFLALSIGLALGILFGIAQQIRGAHFLSHDMATLAICWLTSSSLFLLWFYKGLPQITNTTLK